MKKALLLFLSAALPMLCAAHNEKYVNLFLGSEGDSGQMTPAASYPFGMLSVCPDSQPNQHGGYDYAVPEISGVSINRVSGVGCYGTGGNARIRPADPETSLQIVKGTEKAWPGYYETRFSNGVKGAFTVSRSVAAEKYTFGKKGGNPVFIDFLSAFDLRKRSCGYTIVDDRTIDAWTVSPTACARGTYKLYMRLCTDKPFETVACTDSTVLLSFADEAVEIRIGVSPVDALSAAKEVAAVANRSFGTLRKEAEAAWREKLDKVQVKTRDKEQKILFYTCLYRIYLSPMDVTSIDRRYKGTDGVIYEAGDRRHYSSWSMWDTFRTKFPMLTILEPDIMEDIAASVVDQFRTGKKNWATPNESVPTVRTEHSVIMLLDAYEKGIPVDFLPGYAGMQREAEKDYPRKSPDNKMETSYDLWALARIAEILGKEDDAVQYRREAEEMFEKVWKAFFMTVTDDFADMKDNGMYQGTKWQYRWAAPQYIDRMAEWVGREQLAQELDTFFAEYHFNQGNEPDIHTPFIFSALGYPEKSCELVRKLLTDDTMIHRYGGNAAYPEPFVGRAFQNKTDGLAPEMDEDDGAMSAWYMFCQWGFYPLVAGTPYYQLAAPLFDEVKIRTSRGTTVFRTKGRRSPDSPVKEIRIDGAPLSGNQLPHEVFSGKKTVEFIF